MNDAGVYSWNYLTRKTGLMMFQLLALMGAVAS